MILYQCTVTTATRVKQAVVKFLCFFLPSLLISIPVVVSEPNMYTIGATILWLGYSGYCGYNAYQYGASFILSEKALTVFNKQDREVEYSFERYAIRAQSHVNWYGILRFTSKMIYVFSRENPNTLVASIDCNQMNKKTFKRILWLVKDHGQ